MLFPLFPHYHYGFLLVSICICHPFPFPFPLYPPFSYSSSIQPDSIISPSFSYFYSLALGTTLTSASLSTGEYRASAESKEGIGGG